MTSSVGFAEPIVMKRIHAEFPETMAALQNSIRDHGYTVSRVQRVDIGLTKSGYKTDHYRLVFFGDGNEVKKLTAKYPELAAYLPLKIVIFSEGEDTLLLVNHMNNMKTLYPQPTLNRIFERWQSAISNIMQTTALKAEH